MKTNEFMISDFRFLIFDLVLLSGRMSRGVTRLLTDPRYHTYNTYPRVPQYPPHLAYPLPSQLRGGFGVRGIRGVAHATSVSLLFCDDPHIVSKGVG